MKAIKITTEDVISIVDIKDDWRAITKEIGAELFECVRRLKGLSSNLIMLVDESGLLTRREVNLAASQLYYGGIIVGDVLIVQEDGEDFTDVADIEKVMFSLVKQYELANE